MEGKEMSGNNAIGSIFAVIPALFLLNIVSRSPAVRRSASVRPVIKPIKFNAVRFRRR